MPRLGSIEECVAGPNACWQQYVERVKFFFRRNDITEPIKNRAVLLASVGSSLYMLIRSLLQPCTFDAIGYQEIIDAVSNHYSPKPSEITERFNFNKRNQLQNESIAEYVGELRRLSEFCDYGDTLESMLRDRLVCGLRDDILQTRLLEEINLTFKSALVIAPKLMKLLPETLLTFVLLLRPRLPNRSMHYLLLALTLNVKPLMSTA